MCSSACAPHLYVEWLGTIGTNVADLGYVLIFPARAFTTSTVLKVVAPAILALVRLRNITVRIIACWTTCVLLRRIVSCLHIAQGTALDRTVTCVIKVALSTSANRCSVVDWLKQSPEPESGPWLTWVIVYYMRRCIQFHTP
jgi:hypothetical protein